MVLDERSRHELFLRLEEVLGPQQAETLMEMMPPVRWADVATKRDLDALELRMDLRLEAIDYRFDGMENKILATLRGELLTTVTTQTRTLVLANIGAVLSTAALAFAAAKLA
jgi:hypothetical protein